MEWGERFKVIGAAWEAVEQKAVTGEIELKATDIDGLAQGAARIVLADVPEYESSKPAVERNPDKTGTLGTALKSDGKTSHPMIRTIPIIRMIRMTLITPEN